MLNGAKSSAFRAAQAGYDVWLGNNRGSKYSLGHIKSADYYKHESYWEFSFPEMGKYDLPAQI